MFGGRGLAGRPGLISAAPIALRSSPRSMAARDAVPASCAMIRGLGGTASAGESGLLLLLFLDALRASASFQARISRSRSSSALVRRRPRFSPSPADSMMSSRSESVSSSMAQSRGSAFNCKGAGGAFLGGLGNEENPSLVVGVGSTIDMVGGGRVGGFGGGPLGGSGGRPRDGGSDVL